MKNKLTLLIGGNVGDRLFYLQKTIDLLSKKLGKVIKKSSIYETAAWGFDSEDFYNMALVLETEYSPTDCLNITQGIEFDIGRKEKSKNGNYSARCIDIDLLFYNGLIYHDERLQIPHVSIQERKFVLIPLNEIMEQHIHPQELKSMSELLSTCKDQSEVKKINEYI
ncbi:MULTISPECIES: 2-amino-4-hydroxy-6-hydroxymethyldihydropteridine diphosphokinase [unclassified Lentimicrobium]|uniref:2-amino-4-hydroxy-6- hydroxymethyldihydropteridine diphosphokinase n=1 Tax=unclassified Lentimicrobium TaxID=2677434 RepID=UPI001C131C26|nr:MULTISPECIES: 2-amino-4-hydroxy-6-hydroxymethyldihydropteridine diphosphokinase [unclassified Lentimicrobium]